MSSFLQKNSSPGEANHPGRKIIGLVAVVIALVSTSCGVGGPAPASMRTERKLYEWHDDGGPGKVSIHISLTDQIAEFKRGGRPIGWSYVATGREGYGTAAGSYRITEKIVDKYSNRYGWIEDEFGNVIDDDASPGDRVPKGARYVAAPMPYWMRITSYGIGMHGGVIPQPGKPASHGCIRLPKEFAPVLFNSVVVGTPVTITRQPSRYGPMNEGAVVPEFVGNSRGAESRPRSGPENRRLLPLRAERVGAFFGAYPEWGNEPQPE